MNIQYIAFNDLNLNAPFFDSLKEDYAEFESWFKKKATLNDKAYIINNDKGDLEAFLYLKTETDSVDDVSPVLPSKVRVKVGTFKINPHGTKLGERFIKRIFDHAMKSGIDEIYVTIFPKHTGLYRIFTRYGFEKIAEKTTANGTEDVLLKSIEKVYNNTLLDYPKVLTTGVEKYLLAIKPEFHTELFPDSILNNEDFDILEDISHTNSIHKVYISFMELGVMKPNDIVVIYRTTDGLGSAYYRSVATSVCVLTDIKTRGDFADLNEYLKYCEPHSVFDKKDLTAWYSRPGKMYVLKMTYNAAFTKRLNRKVLIEDIGLDADRYWGFFKLTDTEFHKITKRGGLDENTIVD